MKKLAFLTLTLLAATILLVGLGGCSAPEQTGTPSLDEQAGDIYRSLMCPLCPGQTIEQSQTELSSQMRAIVREKLEQGETKEQILQFFVERYGESVLAAPAKTGFNLVAWLAPFAGIVAGGLLLWLALRKWAGGKKKPAAVAADMAPENTGEEKYLRQLEDELKDFSGKKQ